MVICAGAEDETVAQAITAVENLRDTAGAIIYAYNWIRTSIAGANVFVSPASFVASIISQTSPHIDPAFSGNAGLLYGVNGLKNSLTRSNFISLAAAGICSFENDPDIGFKIKSGVVTQIADSSKILILRRRMAYYLTSAPARFLKNYQNAPLTQANRDAAKAAMLDFIRTQVDLGILPGDNEVQGGRAAIVDVDTPNTNETIAQGLFYINYRQRIFSSARFIVLRAEIGTSVVVTESEA